MFQNNENKAIDAIPKETPLWSDKKRPFFGLPISFTRYTLYPDRLIVRYGLLISRQEEIRLYRVVDHVLRQSIIQRLFRVGSVFIFASDSSTRKYRIESVRQPYEVAHMLSELAEMERRRVGVGFFETLQI